MKLTFNYMKQQIVMIICCFSFLGYSQPQRLSENARMSVLTCGTSDELYALFGHTALRVVDEQEQIDVVFNYGMFDFRTPNFYGKFVKGDLIYYLDANRYTDFVESYREDNRSVYEQPLNLSVAQKQKIWDEVRRHMSSQERYYQYKFIDNNCTTKVVDLLNEVLPVPLKTDFPENDRIYRVILNDYLETHYFEKLGINLIFGAKVDRINNQLFLPDKLMHSIEISKNGHEKLTDETLTVFEATPLKKGMNWNSIYTFSAICFVFMTLSVFQFFRNSYFFVMGFLGIFFLGVGFYSFHQELTLNNVVVMCNPLFLVYIFVKKELKIKCILYYSIVILFVLYLSFVGLEKLKVFMPLIFLNIVVLFLEQRNLKRKFK